VLVVWSASRVAVLSLGYLLTAELGWHRALQPWQTEWVRAVTGWDSVFYIRISHVGYHPGKLEAFFPLYPIGIWAAREGLQVGDAVAALLVSNLAVLAALAGMYVLARDRLSEDHARRSILYLVLSPYAFALTMAYSEGPFLAFTVWMFVLSDREHDLAAVPLGYAAGLTRVTGLALIPPLVLRAWRRRTVSAWLLAFAPAAAFATQAAWLQHAVGDPLGMVHVQAQWGGHPAFPLITLGDQFWRFATTRDFFFLARGVTVIAYLALLVPLIRQERFRATRAEDVLFVCGVFALPLLSSVLQSVGRFGLVAFPLMFAMADIGLRRESWHRAYVVFAPTAQIIFFTAVALGYRPP
jgi:Mannosyltransferase (PIG-V)